MSLPRMLLMVSPELSHENVHPPRKLGENGRQKNPYT